MGMLDLDKLINEWGNEIINDEWTMGQVLQYLRKQQQEIYDLQKQVYTLEKEVKDLKNPPAPVPEPQM